MVQEYTELWAKGLVDKTASGVQSSLKKVFAEKTAGKVYGWACVIYKFEDSVAGWSKTYTAQEKAVAEQYRRCIHKITGTSLCH